MLRLLNALMELSWMAAWASFLVSALTGETIPFLLLIGIFSAGALGGTVFTGRSPLILTVVLVHGAALALCCLAGIHRFQYAPQPLFDTLWLSLFLKGSPGPVHRLATALICVCVFCVYFMGLGLIRRKTDHRGICMRFDIGVAAFFVLFLVFFLLEARLGQAMKDPVSRGMLLPFFIFSLLAIGISANKGKGIKRSFSGPMGAAMAYCVAVLGFGTGLMMFFLPYLTEAARFAYAAVRAGAAPLGPVVMAVLRFMFQPRNIRSEAAGGHAADRTADLGPFTEQGGWLFEAARYFAWGLAVLLALAAAAAVAASLWYLLRRLFSRKIGRPSPHEEKDPLLKIFSALRMFLNKGMAFITRWRSKYSSARDFYLALQRWGRRSGIPRRPFDTPNEYEARLRTAAPSLEGEFRLIAALFNEEAYAGRRLDRAETVMLKGAVERLGRKNKR